MLRFALPAVLLVLACTVLAQEKPSSLTPEQEEAAAKAQQKAELMEVVKKQFGPDLVIAETANEITARYLHPDKKNEAWKYLLTGDLDGDGVEDAVIVVRFKNILAGQTQYDYKVVDPYFTYHGYGDPKITSTLSSDDPDQGHVVLIIHGAGPEAWRAEVPKAKFAVINLLFENLSVSLEAKKRKQQVLNLESREASTSAEIQWDEIGRAHV